MAGSSLAAQIRDTLRPSSALDFSASIPPTRLSRSSRTGPEDHVAYMLSRSPGTIVADGSVALRSSPSLSTSHPPASRPVSPPTCPSPSARRSSPSPRPTRRLRSTRSPSLTLYVLPPRVLSRGAAVQLTAHITVRAMCPLSFSPFSPPLPLFSLYRSRRTPTNGSTSGSSPSETCVTPTSRTFARPGTGPS